ncbi:MAG: DEAD/DEAH box helicase [Myxococcaceae bacterium]|nr:DEAD/DEAH box helicase [Myxococcaceae bacterium]
MRAALWAWLQQEAQAVAAARAAGPVRPPRPTDPLLGPLFDRLSAARAALDSAFPTRPRELKVALGLLPDPLTLELELLRREAGGSWGTSNPRVQLGLTRDGETPVTCSIDRGPCVHRAIALDAALNLLGQDAPVTAAILRELSTPTWQRALAFTTGVTPAKVPHAHELRFVVRLTRRRVALAVVAHKLGKKGPSGSGREVKPLTALMYPGVPATDRRVLEQLALHQPEHDYHEGDPEFLAEALLALEGHPRVTVDDEDAETSRPITVLHGRVGLELDDSPLGHVPRFTIAGRRFDFSTAHLLTRRAGRFIVALAGDTLLLANAEGAAIDFMSGVTRFGATFPEAAHDALLARLEVLKSVEATLPVALAGVEVRAEPRPVARVEPLGAEGLALAVLVRPVSDGDPVVPGEGPLRFTFRRDGQRRYVQRDAAHELELAATLVKSLELPPVAGWQWQLADAEKAIAVIDRLEGLARAGLEVEWPKSRWKLTKPAKASNVSVQVTRKRDWFGVDGKVEVDGERVELAVLLDSVRRRRRWVRLKERQWLKLSEELVEQLQGLANVAQPGKDGLEVTWAALPTLEALEGQLEHLELAKDFAELLTRVRDAAKVEPKLPKGLKAELRDYQLQGFRWAMRLAAWGAGACLADDMGLGKTLQALAVLLARAKEGPSLVVAPTSVVFNWREEAGRFAPPLKVVEYQGAGRSQLLEKLGPHDVVLASWALLTRDAEAFAKKRFATVVLDEAQAIKNAGTQRAKAARELDGGFKLALSGTPLENHLGELWSLFRVVLPGLFGSQEQFRDRFAGPIERDQNVHARAALAAVVRPFLLRRNKSEVAKELPPRTDLSLHVELTPEEKRLYEDARLAAIADLQSGDGKDKRFQALAALTRLRQIACHPRLYDAKWEGAASKLARLLELLADLKAAGHRALVFSQFTSHLALVRDAVTAAGFTLQYLDGSTPGPARQERVEAFQKGDADLFLISLKAGGMGLNLTAADYVVHLDPWWNPAVEDQATDRAHRIGQRKPVTVYRLISMGTVEESILSLHEDKRNLVAGVLEGTGAAGAMSTDELVKLISAPASST